MKSFAKEIPVHAMMVSLLVVSQLALSAVPGVEVVTVLLAAYSAVWGAVRGASVALCFSLLRCLLFGFVPNVVVLYCIYFPLFAVALGLAGKFHGKKSWIPILVGTVMTPLLTLTDNVVTPLITGLRGLRWRLYVYHALPVMGVQTLCALLTLLVLFVPLRQTFLAVAKRVKAKNPREKERKIS